MKTIRKNKPDLLVVLAVFVGLGVLISIYTESMSPTANAESVTTVAKTEVAPSHASKSDYNVDYIKITKVTNQNNTTLPNDTLPSASLPKEQR